MLAFFKANVRLLKIIKSSLFSSQHAFLPLFVRHSYFCVAFCVAFWLSMPQFVSHSEAVRASGREYNATFGAVNFYCANTQMKCKVMLELSPCVGHLQGRISLLFN